MNKLGKIIKYCLFVASFLFLSYINKSGSIKNMENEPERRKANMELIFKVLPPDNTANGRVSFLDETFEDWFARTGECPPDFNKMPSLPFLPNPLILKEGSQDIPIKTMDQWNEKRKWMKEELMKYITGTFPPSPDNLKSKVISLTKDGDVQLHLIELLFGPNHEAKLTLELMIPPGDGPFPVFLTQWNHREWAQLAVRRGYIGCVYAGADTKDDTEKYSEIWAGKYDFTRLMRRAYGASRAIDYLYTLSMVDKEKIGIAGHSRNGKTSLMAAAFDERISACIPSNGCTAAEVPWRYCTEKYDASEIARISSSFPSWIHPRLRFFIGREHKLPVDQNSFMALVAPRGLMLTTALNEGSGNPWGIEQAYLKSQEVFKFLNAENNLAIRSRYGLHSICARDMEDYIDFFDYVFGRQNFHKPENHLFYDYSFEKWLTLSGEKVNLLKFPEKDIDDLTKNEEGQEIRSEVEWEKKRTQIQEQIGWMLGDEPPGVTNPGPGNLAKGGRGETNFGSFLVRPQETSDMGRMDISPYNGFGDQLFGYLYYPMDGDGNMKNKDLPVMIYLHEYDYSKGFNSLKQIESFFQFIVKKGYAVFSFDMLGFGNRIEEGTRFYQRYPHWSKMGKMVADVKGAVDALTNLDFVNSDHIIVAGYSLGATVGLYSAAMDDRIAGVISVAGFTPMRTNTLDRGTEGIMTYSHLHGLIPRLGFFVNNESRIPYDFHDVLACIAPRPIFVIAPKFDKDAHDEDIFKCVNEVKKIYKIFDLQDKIQIHSPEDINRLSPEMKMEMVEWIN